MILNNIQFLRAIAALMVVMHHARKPYVQSGGVPEFESIAYWGSAGVDIFFVISGFVIAMTITQSQQGLDAAWVYAKKRFFRIYLGYWPAFFFALGIAWYLNLNNYEKFDLVRSFLLLPIDPKDGHMPVIGVYWTLAFELYFYSICILAFFIKRKTFNTLLVIYAAIILYRINFISPNLTRFSPLGFFTSNLILEFLAGWFVYEFRHVLFEKKFLLLYVVALPIACYIGVDSNMVGPRYRAFWGIVGVCLVGICCTLEHNKMMVARPWQVSLGNASYAIYLFHIAIMTLLAQDGYWRKFSTNGLDMQWLGLSFFVFMLCVLCVVYYDWIERPLYRWACKGFPLRKGK